jgi:hypothetical protein
MTTRKVILEGTFEWAKVFADNRDLKGYTGPAGDQRGTYEDFDGACSVDVLLDKENFDKLKATGSLKQGSVKEHGLSVKFVRKFKDKFEWASGAPRVFLPDGTPWNFEEDGIIPNGSKGKVHLSVYDTSFGKPGTRLDEVHVSEVAVFEETEEVPF